MTEEQLLKILVEINEVKTIQNRLGDYVDSEFKKVLDQETKIKVMTTIAGIATIALSIIGTIVIAHRSGEASAKILTSASTGRTARV